jgi:hypothetical protein
MIEATTMRSATRTPRGRLARLALAALVALAASGTAPRLAFGEVAGRYQVTSNRMRVKIKSWGEDCGPRPVSSSRRGGKTVDVERSGAHLVVGGQRTDQCWSQNPRAARQKASAAAGRWQVVCETPADDPRFERGEYTLEQRGEDTLQLTELSRYDWRLETDHCEAMIELVRTYERVQEQATDAGAAAETAPRGRCEGTPGPPVRLEVRPSSARVAPSERLCLRAVGRDADGCRVPVTADWARASDGPPGRIDEAGCLVAGSDEGRILVTATAGDLHASVQVEIRPMDISDLLAARLGEAGDDVVELGPGAAAQQARPGAVQGLGGARGARGRAAPSALAWAILGAVLLLTLVMLVLVGTLIARRRRRRRRRSAETDRGSASRVVATAKRPATAAEVRVCPTCHREFDSETFFCPQDATELVPASDAEPLAAKQENKICPKCRRGHPPTASRCTVCDEELVAYSHFRAMRIQERVAGRTAPGGMICPKCAAKYDQEVLYCQKDGSKLVPIN